MQKCWNKRKKAVCNFNFVFCQRVQANKIDGFGREIKLNKSTCFEFLYQLDFWASLELFYKLLGLVCKFVR